uniref:Uncharacterized protein n=1 Tax=Romanomermis culicivorax TaxID=13658 RepID=A0A915KR46_ROMCU
MDGVCKWWLKHTAPWKIYKASGDDNVFHDFIHRRSHDYHCVYRILQDQAKRARFHMAEATTISEDVVKPQIHDKSLKMSNGKFWRPIFKFEPNL